MIAVRNEYRHRSLITLLALVLMLGTVGCATEEAPPPPPPAERVEGTALGIAIAALEGFDVVENGETVVLEPAGALTGHVTISAGEPGKVNLVQALNDHAEVIAAAPNGQYRGQRELVSPLGTAYYSRGSYDGNDGAIEETTILTLHPDGDRILRLAYTYPPGEDSTARLEALMQNILGEIEPLDAPAPAAASDEG